MKNGREIFKSSGDPEDQEVVREREEQARKYLAEFAERRFSGEFKNFLSSVDFTDLKRLFRRIAERSTVDPETMNFVTAERIIQFDMIMPVAAYSPGKNLIFFPYDEIKSNAKELQIDPELYTTFVLCHEEAHATSKIVCRAFSEARSDYQERQTGFAQSIGEKTSFEILEEGVTQKLAMEIFLEYAKTHFDLKRTADFMKKLKGAMQGAQEYGSEVKITDLLIRKISGKSGMPEDKVWYGFIRAKYEGERFEDEELQALLAEATTSDFLPKLKYAKHENIDDLIKDLQ